MVGDKELLNQYLTLEQEMFRLDAMEDISIADVIRNEMDEVWLLLSDKHHAFLNTRNIRHFGKLISQIKMLNEEVNMLKLKMEFKKDQ